MPCVQFLEKTSNFPFRVGMAEKAIEKVNGKLTK